MELLKDLSVVCCFSIFIVYLIKMIKWTLSWNLYSSQPTASATSHSIFVSVIVAVRNEEKTILNLLEILNQQKYPHQFYEIIISNDHSEDQTEFVCNEFINKLLVSHPRITFLNPGKTDLTGKKAALERAIAISRGELILTTDADCIPTTNWIESFVNVYTATHAKMITGFVKMNAGKSVFLKLQALEFLSLSGTGMVSVINEKPLMCNGANLAFSKESFLQAGGYSYGKNHPSGDDTFLMLKLAKEGSGSVVFNKNRDSIMTTVPAETVNSFLSQRIRWAAKVKYYDENYIKWTGGFIFLVNFLILALIILTSLKLFSCEMLFILWILKSIGDLLFLGTVCTFAEQRNLLFVFLPAQLIYPLYSVAGAILASVRNGFVWKGRKY
ncbi:MAG TPA: glycosyltransferase [Bacteroidia bacterium]|nr:glycosyltransferase [Bacteroidia bacterium]